jgi:alanyl-tRNA synthetase
VNSDEIRTAYLKFFEEKGHKVIPSSSLIPKDNPTLLLTTAGVVQIQPYILGQATPPAKRLASCQKCFRTTDIESVGDATHMTFFEMLGNWSVGDYFKKEATAWAWEFVTERLRLPPEKLWITIYLDDEEAFKLWRAIGIPENRIVRCGEKDNFWGPPGSSGPCGPCSEIHFDLGQERSCGADCKPNDGCGRFVEIWNLVFMQYFQDEKGQRSPLAHPCVDTGMGLERTLTAINGKKTAYDTDVFTPLLDRVGEMTGKKYGHNSDDDNAMRIVAEHGRSLAFLIADGVLPDNEGRGYVMRRLLRRGVLFGRRLGLEKPFLAEIAKAAIKKLRHIYPELNKQDLIVKVITMEETRFEETLNTGLAIIDGIMEQKDTKKARQVSGADAFKLYDTYGFPIELTIEIVGKAGFTVDTAGFETEMEKQRERARATHKFDSAAKLGGATRLDVKATAFTGYDCTEQKAKILKLLIDGKEVESLRAGQAAGIILDTTPFYGEMGGQLGDIGVIGGKQGKFRVTNTVRLTPEVILHQGTIVEGTIKVGDQVTAAVDMARRKDIARNHTATHLLQAALRQVLGGHIQQRGSLVAPERLRFDFSHLAAMTKEEISEVQRIVNERIRQNLPVKAEETAYKKAIEAGVTALFDEKYGDVVRVLSIGQPTISAELCGGTHIASTGEIGFFQILSEGSVGAGIRRIEAVTGRGAEAFIGEKVASLEQIARALETTPEKVTEKISGLLEELEKGRKQALALERDKAKNEAESLIDKVEQVNGVKVLAARVAANDQQILRETADYLRDKLGSAIVVLGAVISDRPIFITTVPPDLVEKGYSAGDIIKQVSKVAGGGGGGKANFAQAGGKDAAKLDEALALVKSLIK